jgi:hypothetical protein
MTASSSSASAATLAEVFGPSRAATMRRLEWLTWFTDNAIRVPGTTRTVGADGIASFIPGVGTFIGTGMSLYLVAEALRHGAGARTITRMGGNIALDTVIGAVPVAGFLFDMAFKANQRNLNLLKEEMLRQSRVIEGVRS